MAWYYAEAGRQVGPVDEPVFRELVAAGSISRNTLVWRDGMAAWQAFETVGFAVPPLASEAAAGSAVQCAECRKYFTSDELVSFGAVTVCGACKPLYAQKMREGVAPFSTERYGGFWIRFGAVMIDAVILYIVGFILAGAYFAMRRVNPNDITSLLLAEGVLIGVQVVIAAAYETLFTARFGGTPGKLVCRLAVVTPDGRRISYQRALSRYGAKLISSFTLCIGYLMVAFDDEKRALHDRICDTRVVRR